MRLKSLNLKERSQNYSNSQSVILEKVTKTITELGKVFDAFVELENFITANILDETVELIKVRENRKKIELQYGSTSYIDEHFKPIADRLNAKIKELVKEWNEFNPDFEVNRMNKIVSNLKMVNKFIESMSDSGLDSSSDTTECINGMINDFGRFKVAKSVLSNNPVDQINNTLKARDEILNYRKKQEKTNGTADEDISIDDL